MRLSSRCRRSSRRRGSAPRSAGGPATPSRSPSPCSWSQAIGGRPRRDVQDGPSAPAGQCADQSVSDRRVEGGADQRRLPGMCARRKRRSQRRDRSVSARVITVTPLPMVTDSGPSRAPDIRVAVPPIGSPIVTPMTAPVSSALQHGVRFSENPRRPATHICADTPSSPFVFVDPQLDVRASSVGSLAGCSE